MRRVVPLQRVVCALLGIMALPLMALAQTPSSSPSLEERLAKAEAAVASAQTAGDNAWMLVCSALVLLMTGPGLALFYGGLVRRKNVLGTMMQSFIMMAVITVVWALFGYSLAFAKGSAFIGGLGHLFLKGVGAEPSVYAGTIPAQTFMVYQLMFAIITPALITGAFAERMKFSAMLLFCTLWAVVVYFPLAHMVWGDGGYLNAFLGGKIPALDFAGGTVVHISSGFSALVCALYLGKRLGYPKTPFAPHNLVLSVIGACLLWVGWFGFNAGSAVAAGSLASSAFVATHFGAAAATLGWLLVEWLKQGKPTVLGGISGAVAGLVGITPAAGFVTPMGALAVGFIAGVVCFFAVTELKKKLGYDDSLDAFGVHGVGGFTGAILTGVFANSAVNTVFKDANGKPLPSGLLEGNGKQVVNQLVASLIAIVLGMVASYIILKIVDATVGVRVTGEDESVGLDLSQHGEEGYNLDADLGTTIGSGTALSGHSFAAATATANE
ncbi:MAG: ammonium transporter [Acidobacteria bacterium]|nr:ammonium transporter [Acidobacteriota bacterium]MBI3423143.1 ammonium transporter [Acidobacteriota bacterium]